MTDLNSLLKELGQRPIHYFPIYKAMTGSVTGGILLARLIYWTTKRKDNWKTDATLMEETGLSEEELKSAKRRIKQLPFIKVEVRGFPPRTWYEIDMEKCVEMVTLISGISPHHLGEDAPSFGAEPTSAYRKSVSPSGSKIVQTSQKPIHPRWIRFASMLAKAVGKVRKLNATSKIAGWALHLRKLSTVEGLSNVRIRETLKWYCSMVERQDLIKSNPDYIPIAYSGESFRNKFTQIEAARERLVQEEKKPAEAIQLSKGAQQTYDQLKTQLRMAGLSSVNGLKPFAQSLSRWRVRTRKALRALRDDAEGRVNTVAEQTGGMMDSTLTQPLRDAEACLDRVVPQFGETYINWIVSQVSSWEHWEGSLKAFHPGGKHFLRFLRMMVKQIGWGLARKFGDILETREGGQSR